MSTTDLTTKQKAIVIGACLLGTAVVVGAGLLLRAYGPGNMGNGFLAGAAVALVACAVMTWRVVRRPHRTTTFERGFTRVGDERDDAVLTRALAVLGLLAVPTTGCAAIAIALGAPAAPALTVLMVAQVAVLAVSFAVVNRRI